MRPAPTPPLDPAVIAAWRERMRLAELVRANRYPEDAGRAAPESEAA